jgi:glycosyltransferase involved in cell wall biosynthesis
MNSTTMPLGSVVIPAWNEAPVIARTLDALFTGVPAGSLEVIVSCNGCTDGTEDVVGASGHPVQVLSLPAVGKSGSIRAAEQAASSMPRLYLDADVELPGSTALALLDRLRAGVPAVRPPIRYDYVGASWIVRSYMAARLALPTVSGQLFGAGIYGLSSSTRRRFGEFPDVVADDLFVARLVRPEEIEIPDSCEPAVVRMPRTARALVATLARVRSGNRQLARLMPDLAPTSTRATAGALMKLSLRPRLLPHICVYVVIVTIARARSRLVDRDWERDETTRPVAEVAR